MRILVATGQWFPDRRSGFARVVTETASGLAELGHEVTVLAPSYPGEPVEQERGSLTVLRAIRRSALPLTLTDVAETALHTRRRRFRHFDMLLAHSTSSALGLLAAGLRAPLALVFHASVPLEIRFERSHLALGMRKVATYPLEPALVLFENVAVRHAQRILVLSEYSRRLVLDAHPRVGRRIRGVSGGVDTDYFSPADDRLGARSDIGVPPTVSLLFTVRRLEPRMGLENLLAAVAVLRQRRPVALAIAGEGSLGGRLRVLSTSLGVADCVSFLGSVSEGVLRSWYRAADLFLLPTVAYEGFGLVTVEALACGTPVVGTPVGATPEILVPLDPELVAASPEPEDLAATIEHVLRTAGSDLRDRCRVYASSRFAWKHVITDWEKALDGSLVS